MSGEYPLLYTLLSQEGYKLKSKGLLRGAVICTLAFLIILFADTDVYAEETYTCDGCETCRDTIERRYVGSHYDVYVISTMLQ